MYYVDDNRAAKADFRCPKLLPQNPGNMNKFPAYFRACLLTNTTRRVGDGGRGNFFIPFLRISFNSSARSHPRKRHFKSNAVDVRNVQPPTNWWLKRSRDKSRNYAQSASSALNSVHAPRDTRNRWDDINFIFFIARFDRREILAENHDGKTGERIRLVNAVWWDFIIYCAFRFARFSGPPIIVWENTIDNGTVARSVYIGEDDHCTMYLFQKKYLRIA